MPGSNCGSLPLVFFLVRHDTPRFDTVVTMQITVFTALSFLSSPRTSMSQESELMKSEMQIMTAQLGSTMATDENPRPDKGEKNGSIFIFIRMPPRDKRIFTSSARKHPTMCISHVNTLRCN